MPVPADYLYPSEKRELAELVADRAELRRPAHEMSARVQLIKARGAHRMESARVATGART